MNPQLPEETPRRQQKVTSTKTTRRNVDFLKKLSLVVWDQLEAALNISISLLFFKKEKCPNNPTVGHKFSNGSTDSYCMKQIRCLWNRSVKFPSSFATVVYDASCLLKPTPTDKSLRGKAIIVINQLKLVEFISTLPPIVLSDEISPNTWEIFPEKHFANIFSLLIEKCAVFIIFKNEIYLLRCAAFPLLRPKTCWSWKILPKTSKRHWLK